MIDALLRIRTFGINWMDVLTFGGIGLTMLGLVAWGLIAKLRSREKLPWNAMIVVAAFAASILGILALVTIPAYKHRPDFVTKHGIAVWTNVYEVNKDVLEDYIDTFLVDLAAQGYTPNLEYMPDRLVWMSNTFTLTIAEMGTGLRTYEDKHDIHKGGTIWIGYDEDLPCTWLAHAITHAFYADPLHNGAVWSWVDGAHRRLCRNVNYSREVLLNGDTPVARTPEGVTR